MKHSLLAYKVGLAIVGVLVIGVVIAVVREEGKLKHDVATDKAANAIADKLNGYVTDKQRVPDSLEVAGVRHVPVEVAYYKLSGKTYKFCVTYQTGKGNFGSTN